MNTDFGKHGGFHTVKHVHWGSPEMPQDSLELCAGDGSCLGEGHLGRPALGSLLRQSNPSFSFVCVQMLYMIIFYGSSTAKP